MLKPTGYIVSVIILILAQIFIFDKINILGYANLHVYILLVMLMPTKIRQSTLLFIGFGFGLLMDIVAGKAGLCAMTLTLLAFIRQPILELISGRELIEKNVTPTAASMGQTPFIIYVFVLTFAYVLPYTMLESMTFTNFGSTILRIIFSTISTTIAIYICHLPLLRRTIARR